MNKFSIILFFTFFTAYIKASETKVLFIGDSLTAGYGVKSELAYPSLVEKKMNTKGNNKIKIINAGISGSTTSGGLKRLKWYLKTKPEILFLALGANDGLRGVKVSESTKNLTELIKFAQSKGLVIVLAGMKVPPNYGKQYSDEFEQMFIKLSQKYKLDFIPFLLEGVAGNKDLNQADGIHPNEKGHQIIANLVAKKLKEIM